MNYYSTSEHTLTVTTRRSRVEQRSGYTGDFSQQHLAIPGNVKPQPPLLAIPETEVLQTDVIGVIELRLYKGFHL